MAKGLKIINKINKDRLNSFKQEMRWVYSYARHYWKQMIIYALLGMTGTVVSLLSGFVSRDMVDIITGHQVGQVITTFAVMIGVMIGNTLITQVSSYVSTKINVKVDTELKADIFSKMLVTDWESLSQYHTGDLLVRWNSDVSTISSGVLTFVPNFVIYLFRFGSALVIMLINDWTFAANIILNIIYYLI